VQDICEYIFYLVLSGTDGIFLGNFFLTLS
jgi:hypothetical protein